MQGAAVDGYAFYVEPPHGSRYKFMFDLISLEPIAIGTIEQPVAQSNCGIAIGRYAGYYHQGQCAIAIGEYAGYTWQGDDAVAIAPEAGALHQKPEAIAIGIQAGQYTQGQQAIALGYHSGGVEQRRNAIAIGADAGLFHQGTYAIAIGAFAGQTQQPEKSIILNASGVALTTTTRSEALYVNPIGAGSTNRMLYYNTTTKEIVHGDIPSGTLSGGTEYSDYLFWNGSAWNVGTGSVHLGSFAGKLNPSTNGIALGYRAGQTNQAHSAVAIGVEAGGSQQGTYAIAIGAFAGQTQQHERSIVLNASGSPMTTLTQEACYIRPVRANTASQILYYNTSSGEVTRGDPTFSDITLATRTYAYFQARDAVLGKFMFTDCADKDAFYRLRISDPTTLFEGSTIYDANALFFDNDVTANASVTGPVDAAMTLSVSAASTTNQYAARQTHYYAHYQPGKSLCAYFSFCFGAPVAGITRRVGFYDIDATATNLPRNGVVLEQTLAGLEWRLYRGDGVTIQIAAQAAWNVDPLNGLGPSGVTLDTVNNLLGFVDMEWLGVGRVRVGFFIAGLPVICHTFDNLGISVPYLSSAALPVRYEIRKTANTAATGTMRTVCCTVLSEGGFEPMGVIRAYQSSVLILSGTEAKTCLAIRLRNGYARAMLVPSAVEIISNLGGNAIAYFSVYLWRPSSSTPPSIATWTTVDPLSMVESTTTDLKGAMDGDTAGIAVLLQKGTVSATTKVSFAAVKNALLAAQSAVSTSNRDILMVVIHNNSTGTNRQYSAIFTWKEI